LPLREKETGAPILNNKKRATPVGRKTKKKTATSAPPGQERKRKENRITSFPMEKKKSQKKGKTPNFSPKYEPCLEGKKKKNQKTKIFCCEGKLKRKEKKKTFAPFPCH